MRVRICVSDPERYRLEEAVKSISLDGGETWEELNTVLVQGRAPNEFVWTIPEGIQVFDPSTGGFVTRSTVSARCMIRVATYDGDASVDYDVSDGMFTIGASPADAVTAPRRQTGHGRDWTLTQHGDRAVLFVPIVCGKVLSARLHAPDGRCIAQGVSRGRTVAWSLRGLPAGVYLVRAESTHGAYGGRIRVTAGRD
jgi:hypothetical protein